MTSNFPTPNPAIFVPERITPYDVRLVPLPAPAAGIFDAPTVKICVNSSWVSHVDGVLERLLYRDAWTGTTAEIERAVGEVRKLLAALATIGDCDEPMAITDIRVNGCALEVQYNNSGVWVGVGDLSACAVPGPPGPPGQDGEDGAPGEQGPPGQDGAPGEDCDCKCQHVLDFVDEFWAHSLRPTILYTQLAKDNEYDYEAAKAFALEEFKFWPQPGTEFLWDSFFAVLWQHQDLNGLVSEINDPANRLLIKGDIYFSMLDDFAYVQAAHDEYMQRAHSFSRAPFENIFADAIATAYEFNQREFALFAWQSSAYHAGGDCETLIDRPKAQVEWCYQWDFTAGQLGQWSEITGDGAELGVGWRGAYLSTFDWYDVDLIHSFPETTITGVSVEFSHQGPGTCWQKVQLLEGGQHNTVIDEVRAPSPATVAWAGSIVATGIRVQNISADMYNGGLNAIRKVKIVGVGAANPFGENNC